MATPFHSDREETLDLESFARCIRFMKRAGVDGVTITGVLGESNRLIDSERVSLVVGVIAMFDSTLACGEGHENQEPMDVNLRASCMHILQHIPLRPQHGCYMCGHRRR